MNLKRHTKELCEMLLTESEITKEIREKALFTLKLTIENEVGIKGILLTPDQVRYYASMEIDTSNNLEKMEKVEEKTPLRCTLPGW